MQKKLTRHGNSAALVIDKPILDLLKIDMDTTLELRTDGQSLIISPVSPDKTQRKKSVSEALKKVNRNHSDTLKKLAQ